MQSTASHLVVIGDIRASRRVPERAAVQASLEHALEAINGGFREEITAGFVVTLGDEFQGVLARPSAAVDVLLALEWALEDIQVRYGLGWGTISTGLRELAVGMDGPCFHNAREAVVAGKRADRWVSVSGFGDDDEVLNGLFWIIGAVRGQWTEVQRQTVHEVRSARTQRAAAAARNVSEATVSKALKSALHEPVLAAERAVTAVLRRYDGPDPGRREGR
jgi:hypothetical protein